MFSKPEAPDSGQIQPEFGEWWREISPRLEQSARARARDKGEADDLVQEVALVALRRRKRFQSQGDLLRWAFTVLHSRLIDSFRSRKRQEARFEMLWRLVPSSYRPAAEREIDFQRLTKKIGELPPRQQEVMRRTLFGESTGEIAQALNITEATVRSLRRFAQLSLAERMGIPQE